MVKRVVKRGVRTSGGLAALMLLLFSVPVLASLSGSVINADADPLEGVVVSATEPDSGMTVSVSTDSDGQFVFPTDRLSEGAYELSIRAAGFEWAQPENRRVAIPAEGSSLTITVRPVTDPEVLASQLTSLEWLNSFPGSTADKDLLTRNMVNCAFCHSLERIARSNHDADGFMKVIQRMKTYETDHSSSVRIQRVAEPEPLEGLAWYGRDARAISEYLATVNLAGEKTGWDYPLQTLPRPAGAGTRAVVTVFPIPRPASVVHDLDVDAQGNVWYGNTGWDYLGKLNPTTGKFSEWPAPNFLPPAAGEGVDRIVGVQDIQVDPQGKVWAAVMGNKHAAFDPELERWQVFDLPVIWKNPFLGPVRDDEVMLWGSGITQPPEGEERYEHAFALNTATGELSKGIALFAGLPSPTSPTHADRLNYCYMFDQDEAGDFICTASETSAIVRAGLDGSVERIPTPTPHAYPRRGYRDDNNRFWFSEFFADRVGMLDLATNQITEFPLSPRYISPYFTRPDRNGHIWISSTGSDRLLRLIPETGEVVSYLMPVYYDARKVVLDESAPQVTVWLPNKNAAELIRVELLTD
ncbi:conserved hypothetical protein [Luminiphilus syltensis NOR5-1B]|uniref:Streptogramin lyase n=1 Tax=Luminiphilus syltensis NOR5-1B TaxID=565045 RepID=B8KSL4_9GAMM|nr:carboxypeptidase regulatory-like domain-containing protein [Luminiphilus syltensis]EED34550.1 conserved hypothetical protein [Luminiphilus syltensis NOR5-1B]